MSVCTGRTPRANDLLTVGGVELAIPVVCFMEAHHVFRRIKAAKTKLIVPVHSEIEDVGRDPGEHAQKYVQSLSDANKAIASADFALVNYLSESEERLLSVIERVTERARLLCPSPAVLTRRAHSFFSDPTDDMIGDSILEDASSNKVEHMAFLSEDRDFELPMFGEAMKAVGIQRLETVEASIMWCYR